MSTTAVDPTHGLLVRCASTTKSRLEFWSEFIRAAEIRCMAELGVYRGDFASAILQSCQCVNRYYMLDPWRHLDDWNKPANQDDPVFERFFQEAKTKTNFAEARRIILRGKTTEVVDRIPDGELDFAYIDADHTLKGVAIDLIRVYPKVRPSGFIGGDDFSQTMWPHRTSFEPTLVFPFAVYFAEAVGATIYALPNIQFCLHKAPAPGFRFVDLTGHYRELGLRNQLAPEKLLKLMLGERFPRLRRAARKIRDLIA